MTKRRIMSRSQICEIMAAEIDRKEIDDPAKHRQAQMDALFYIVADGKEVKIYHDTDMGGTVVEF